MTDAADRDGSEHRDPIVFDYDLDAAPEVLWRALTEPALVAAWLAPNDMTADESAADVGQRFRLQPSPDGPVDCAVLESEPARRLSYRWRERPEEGPPLDSIVTFEITPRPGGGSHLRLVHGARNAIGAGGLVGANDNEQLKGWSLAWAA